MQNAAPSLVKGPCSLTQCDIESVKNSAAAGVIAQSDTSGIPSKAIQAYVMFGASYRLRLP